MDHPYLIAGLGNPGPEYARHRHNVGFMAIDALAKQLCAESFAKKFQAEAAKASCDGQKLILLKPQTYMNHSGRAVQAAAAFYKIPPEHILVMQDEIDLPVGKLRIKKGGGANGQNGIRDIDAAIGTDYWRARLGVGRPQHGEVHGHVLSDFSREERETVDKMLEALAQYFPLFWQHSPAALMSKVADTMNPPVKKRATGDKAAST